MVYFTCDACGEQLKKPSVEKHYTQKCRECWKLTCIDCLKVSVGFVSKTIIQFAILFRISLATSIKATMPACPRTSGIARRADQAGIQRRDR